MPDLNQKSLYSDTFEHDACGIGAVVNIDGVPSHAIVDDALSIVEHLEHRAGKDASGTVGDGVGIMVQIPHGFFTKIAKKMCIDLGGVRDYGVGMFFFEQNTLRRRQAQKMFEVICEKEGVRFLAWREVPTNADILSEYARESMPCICQCFVARPENLTRGLDFDRKLYVIRRVFEHCNDTTYVSSLSSRTIVYKGMFLVGQLRRFYPDLEDAAFESAIAMVHSRFSTNTTPSWERAHPNRFILHNGEINTIRGNADRMLAREETMHSLCMEEDMDKVLPVISGTGSDSAMLDNTLEFLVMNGIPLPLAVMITIPEPWKNDPSISRSKRDLYRYYATMMEPWDGPAAILFSDGDLMGAVLDRNGLRPARYYITKDRRLILSSEVGVLDIPPSEIVCKSRLQPGTMLLVDTIKGAVISDEECKEAFAARQPYGEWLDSHLVTLAQLSVPNAKVPHYSKKERNRLYKAFGYPYEDITEAILPMARDGAESTSAMGVDIPLAVLSEKHQPLFSYFKQLFAQVTNPPIDALREEVVTDTTVYVGSDGNLLCEKPENCTVLQIRNPILTSVDLMKIRHMNKPGFRVQTVSLLYYKNSTLKKAIDRLFVECDRAYRDGANIIILSDRGVDENHVAVPSLLAVSAIEQYLIRTRVRLETDGKLMSGRDVAIACILGAEEFGFATAPLISMGCVMMRVCNLDTCPVGIATQNPALRCRFSGKPEYVMNFMMFIAEELREIMAKLGVRTVDELVGNTKKIRVRKNSAAPRAKFVDLSAVLCEDLPPVHNDPRDTFDFALEKTPDEAVLLPAFEPYFKKKKPHTETLSVSCLNRTTGTILGSVITERFGDTLPDDTYTVRCMGSGGQSFGAFLPRGMTMKLIGDSNDYFGKGLSGGKLIVKPDPAVTFAAKDNIIIGNVALYGATGGEAYINGIAGERFCVRNSGAVAVVEGCGDHGCEYMTGGRAVILGNTGKNFAAGMSGGIAYVLDEKHDLYLRLNKQMVTMSGITEAHDAKELRSLIEKHVEATDSPHGREILSRFEEYLPKFKKIIPNDYHKMLIAIGQLEERGMSHEQAKLEAFYLMQNA